VIKVTGALKCAAMAALLGLAAACANKPAADVNAAAGSGADVMATPGSQADLEQSAGHRVFFAYDQYNLTTDAQATLRRQAEWLKKYPSVSVLVAGNCDERGTREYNLALGARRAETTRQFLVANGVLASRITTVSYGKERPVAPGSSESAWSMNRNATTTIAGASS
jgi:peptidoglycan-associated lipoprotein